MKILDIELNNRVNYSINFDKPQRQNVNFIIQKNDTQLFGFRNFQDNKILLQTQQEKKKLVVDYELQRDTNAKEAILYVNLHYSSGGRETKTRKLEVCLDDQEWGGFIELDRVKAIFRLYTDTKNDEHHIDRYVIFTICEEKDIFNVVLDFGSEASQMAISRRGGDIGVNSITNIFSLIKNHYEDKEDYDGKDNKLTKDSDYIQYGGSTNLYRSFFYIKKVIEEVASPDPWNPDTRTEMSFLSHRKDWDTLKKDYIALPNAKIATFGGVPVPQIEIGGIESPISDYGDDYFYRKAIDNFIFEALNFIKDRNQRRKKAVNICILMPNVYPLPSINKKLSDLSTDIEKMLTLSGFKDILGYELSFVSESDASMLGLFAANTLQAFTADAGNYLIMDAGKGTLDFSILNYNPRRRKRYKNLCRSGIIGAGNAISYAIALALIFEFIEQNCSDFDVNSIDNLVKKVVYRNVINADLSEQFEFLNLVEDYKKKYNGNAFKTNRDNDYFASNERTRITTDEIKLKGINSFIKNLDYRIPDKHAYIENEMSSIALDILMKLEQVTNHISGNERHTIHIDKVIFTGRGFLMDAFREKILLALKELEQDIEVAGINEPGHEKDICLYISGLLSSGAYDVSLDGTPILLEKPKNQSPEIREEKHKREDSHRSNIKKIIKAVSGVLAPDNTADDAVEIILAGNVDSSTDNTARLSSFADVVNIGGVTYELPNLPDNALQKTIHFYYDGEEFLFVLNGKEYKFRQDRVNLKKWHDFQSLFPNVCISNEDEVVIPQNVVEHYNNIAVMQKQQIDAKQEELNKDSKTKDSNKQEDIDEIEGGFTDNMGHLIDKVKNWIIEKIKK